MYCLQMNCKFLEKDARVCRKGKNRRLSLKNKRFVNTFIVIATIDKYLVLVYNDMQRLNVILRDLSTLPFDITFI